MRVYDSDTLLTQGIDYTVSYKNNTKAFIQQGENSQKAPTVTIKGKGNYEKSATETFRIVPQSIAAGAAEVVIPDLFLAYTGTLLRLFPP